MEFLPEEQKLLFDEAVEDILRERGSALYLTDALEYAERAVVSGLLSGKSEITLDLGHIVQTAEAQKEVKDLFREYTSNLISDWAWDVIDRDLYPNVKN
jgi:putative transcriptional regulator